MLEIYFVHYDILTIISNYVIHCTVLLYSASTILHLRYILDHISMAMFAPSLNHVCVRRMNGQFALESNLVIIPSPQINKCLVTYAMLI